MPRHDTLIRGRYSPADNELKQCYRAITAKRALASRFAGRYLTNDVVDART